MDENEALRNEIREHYKNRNFIFVPNGPGSLLQKNGIFIPVLGYEILFDDDFYPVANGKKFDIKHTGLMRLARCAGVKWETESDKVGRVDKRENPDYCSYRMVAQIRLADGTLEPYPAQKHIDLSEEKKIAEAKALKNFDFQTKNAGKTIGGRKIYPPNPADVNSFVKLKSEETIAQRRIRIDELCESGAQNRAIKKAMLIPAYDPDPSNKDRCCMAGKEFFIVRYMLDPNRPEVLNAQLGQLANARENIYRLPTPAKQEQIPETIDVTPKEERNPEIVDFENLDLENKIKTIEQFSEFSNYEYLKEDIRKNGTLDSWTEKQLIDYFIHLKTEDEKRV